MSPSSPPLNLYGEDTRQGSGSTSEAHSSASSTTEDTLGPAASEDDRVTTTEVPWTKASEIPPPSDLPPPEDLPLSIDLAPSADDSVARPPRAHHAAKHVEDYFSDRASEKYLGDTFLAPPEAAFTASPRAPDTPRPSFLSRISQNLPFRSKPQAERIDSAAKITDKDPSPEGAEQDPPGRKGSWEELTERPTEDAEAQRIDAAAKLARLASMDYGTRNREIGSVAIKRNLDTEENRQAFILNLANALLSLGAPTHRIEDMIVATGQVLEVLVQALYLPGTLLITFAIDNRRMDDHRFIPHEPNMDLGRLQEIHDIYRKVVYDDITARDASDMIAALMERKPTSGLAMKACVTGPLVFLVCGLAFGGSLADALVAGLLASGLELFRHLVVTRWDFLKPVLEMICALAISFIGRALSAIHGHWFCYGAIVSSGIVTLLPGYMIVSSALELAQKNMFAGSIHLVYTLVYGVFIEAGLHIGSWIFFFDGAAEAAFEAANGGGGATVKYSGTLLQDPTTAPRAPPLTGTFTYSNALPAEQNHIVQGCYRHPHGPWVAAVWPWWTVFIIVPIYSLLSSIDLQQPIRGDKNRKNLLVMSTFCSIAYAVNRLANKFITDDSGIVSLVGAYVLGVLGNWYGRMFHGTAFVIMLPGVLFLVPSGLAASKTLLSNAAVDTGLPFLEVSLSITVGLMLALGTVYAFGTRNGRRAIFAF